MRCGVFSKPLTNYRAIWPAPSRHERVNPWAGADLVATVIALPNSASVAELLVNCILEDVV